ncbi:MAG: ABC transporter ATP-binding protein [Alphaproteobacteria bacterium]|nr:ABC transporter ATP-binding protein [Alphaproteobacteria bacterium]
MSDTTAPPAGNEIPQLQLTGITKQYPRTLANDDIDLVIMPGEVHALLGENGAGKSTLVKIIYGVVKADRGEIKWQGRHVDIHSPSEARALGIGMVFQHFNLFETLTVAENISLGLDSDHDLKKLTSEIQEISERYGLPINPHRHIHALSVGERQRVEIIRCLVQHPKLLIMDEPTSVLTPQEVEKLFETLRRLASEGCSILYISHKLDEIQALCDGATVLRGGKVTAHCTPRNETPKSLAEMMIGSELPVCHRTEPVHSEEICLNLNGLSLESPDPHGTDLKNIQIDVRKGEIFGIAGVAGNGQKELFAAINGEVISPRGDMIRLNGNDVAQMGPTGRRRLGLAFVPEERLGRGAVPEMSLADNALLTGYLHGLVHSGFVRFEKVDTYATEVRQRFDVRSAGIEAEAKSLSGGNLQKFIIGREVMFKPDLLVLAHPTWGVDVGAATTIHQAVVDLAMEGTSVLVVSEDLDELFEICDRIAVIAEGRLSPAKRTMDTNVEEVGLWMSGQFAADETEGSTRAA